MAKAKVKATKADPTMVIHGVFKAGKQIGVTKPHVCPNPPTCTEEERLDGDL